MITVMDFRAPLRWRRWQNLSLEETLQCCCITAGVLASPSGNDRSNIRALLDTSLAGVRFRATSVAAAGKHVNNINNHATTNSAQKDCSDDCRCG
jgi:hypothetical protein